MGKTKKPKSKPKVKAKTKVKTPAKAKKKLAVAKSPRLSHIITPLDDRVLVQLENPKERVTTGGLIIPETASQAGSLKGVVVAVGPGHRNKKGRLRPMDVKIGDHVLFSEWTGSKISVLNYDVHILRESEILGVVEG